MNLKLKNWVSRINVEYQSILTIFDYEILNGKREKLKINYLHYLFNMTLINNSKIIKTAIPVL